MVFTLISHCAAGDAKNEVPVTNLAKIEFPGKKKKNGCKFSLEITNAIRLHDHSDLRTGLWVLH